MKSESDEVDPPSKQIQDEKTDMVAQTKDDFSLVIELEMVASCMSSHCDAPKGIMGPKAWKLQEIKLKVKEVPEN